ncbi:MAG TPA: cobalt ECF transporter T component CbiQ [Aestuariivirga sp.]|nr:cobalt ECF transporter T component CbiQ [Aestuariivirga sp.]
MSGGHASSLFWQAHDHGLPGKLDPRVRLLAVLAFVLSLPALHSAPALGTALLMGIALVALARLPLVPLLKRLAVMEGFLLLLLLSLPFTMPGNAVFHLGPLAASWDGIIRSLTIMARVTAAALVIAAFLSGLGSLGLASAMAGLGLPPRIVALFLLTFRHIGLLQQEYDRLTRAMKARAFRLSTSAHVWTALGQLLGLLLIRAEVRAQRLSRAMKARAFSGQFIERETSPLTRHDYAALVLWGLGLAGLLFWDRLS